MRLPFADNHNRRGSSYRPHLTTIGLASALAIVSTFFPVPPVVPHAEAAFPGVNGRLAFQAFMDVQTAPIVNSDIFTVHKGGAGLQQITNGPALDCGPAWSPDGRSIAFERSELFVAFVGPAPTEIYLATEGVVTNLTKTPTAMDVGPSWSPDGSQLVFSSDRAGLPRSEHDLYIMDVKTGIVRSLLQAPGDQWDPAWSPDGRWIAYVDVQRLKLVSADGLKTKSVPNAQQAGAIEYPDWSPAGRTIAFSARASAESSAQTDVWVIEVDGTGLTNLTNTAADNFGPAWSPNGKEIAFLSNRDEYRKLYTMRADGSHVREVIDIEMSAVGCPPSWGPRP